MNAQSIIGKNIPRTDGRAKATGQAIYADDIKLPGMLHGKLLRSPLPHARILSIDTPVGRAAMPGVHCVITGQDIPRVTYGNWRLFPGTQDEYALAMDKVRFIGDEVAAVAAVDRETAEAAIEQINVEYEELPGVFDVTASLAKGAPVVHDTSPTNISIDRKIAYGDIEAGFAASDYVREGHLHRPRPSATPYMEPCACVAQTDLDDRITLWTSTQTPLHRAVSAGIHPEHARK